MSETSALVINAAGFIAGISLTLGLMGGEGAFGGPGLTPADYTKSGAIPAIALFNDYGEPTGRWHPDFGGRGTWMDAGYTWFTEILHGERLQGSRFAHPKHGSEAGYILLSAPEHSDGQGNLDAICISAVMVEDAQSSNVILGDVPAKCGVAWYYGGQTVKFLHGEEFTPNCIWLDYDGSAGENSARSLSFHLRSWKVGTDRGAQINAKNGDEYSGLDMYCKSTPRFAWWSSLKQFSWIPFFDPPLEFIPDSVSTEAFGLDADPGRIMDEGNRNIDRSVERYIPPNMSDPYEEIINHSHDHYCYFGRCRKARAAKKRIAEPKPKQHHLIISPHPKHTGSGLCESETSRGHDFVSLGEGTFCDMETKTLYPLCDEKEGLVTNCFRLGSQMLVLPDGEEVWQDVGNSTHVKRGVTPKVYVETEHWSF